MDLQCFLTLLGLAVWLGRAGAGEPVTHGPSLEHVRVSDDGTRFVLASSGNEFTPWGFNYDHDAGHRLLEAYWEDEWPTVIEDFEEMKALGANTVRIHLQTGRFMNSATELNRASLERLARLVRLAETNRLYLIVTGLGCYLRKETPAWYNELAEPERWAVQARFWGAVAATCRASPAVFGYDLMNEPIVTEDKAQRDWTPGEFGGMCFVQRITLDLAGRTPTAIAKAWVNTLVAAIRKQDARHLITIGAIPWAITFPGAKPLFYSSEVGADLDFVSLHVYPKSGEVERTLAALEAYRVGKPIVIGELFPLHCSVGELDEFIAGSRQLAVGWIGFYWGKTIAEHRQADRGIAESLTLGWLDYFARTPLTRRAPRAGERGPEAVPEDAGRPPVPPTTPR